MRISEILIAIASWLESPDNEAILLSEYNDDCLKIVAQSCVEAADTLKKAATQVNELEPTEESTLTGDSLQDLANIATAFDSSGDPGLKKQASVIDELLMTIASPPHYFLEKKIAEEKKIDELKKKYQQPREELYKDNKIAESEKALADSNMMKHYKILEAPLSTRYCPDHAGASIYRIGEHIWQCELDKKTYNFETGFDLINGSRVPGGDVANQTLGIDLPYHGLFDSRDERLSSR